MKKVYYIEPNEKIVEIMDKESPISLKYNEDLVNRVHARFPVEDKAKIALIIKNIFIAIRKYLILGYILEFYGFFYGFFHPMKSRAFHYVKIKTRSSIFKKKQ